MYVSRRNYRVVEEIGVEEHDGDVRFYTGSGNIAVSRMRIKICNITLRNSSVIVIIILMFVYLTDDITCNLK